MQKRHPGVVLSGCCFYFVKYVSLVLFLVCKTYCKYVLIITCLMKRAKFIGNRVSNFSNDDQLILSSNYASKLARMEAAFFSTILYGWRLYHYYHYFQLLYDTMIVQRESVQHQMWQLSIRYLWYEYQQIGFM